jgi:hypothetical protein
LAVPDLSFTFLLPEGVPLPELHAREVGLRAALAGCTDIVCVATTTGSVGPDMDTQFQVLETGVLLVTATAPDGARWTVGAADLERVAGRPWGVSSRHARATVRGATDLQGLLRVHDAVAAAFAALGHDERSFVWPSHFLRSLLLPLRLAGEWAALESLTARCRAGLLAPCVPIDPLTRTLGLAGCAAFLDVEALLAAMPDPERYATLDLRDDDLRRLPAAIGRFTAVERLVLDDNLLEEPDLATLAALPRLRVVELRGNPLRAGVAERLVAAGYRP